MSNKAKKVLVVEDDRFLLSIYATKFEKEGYEVLIAENGEDGLEIAIKEKPSIILLDILMPKMNGFDFLDKIKSKKEYADIPVILLTNLSQDKDIDKGLAMGANDYLVKAHFMPAEVVAKVEEVLVKKK